MLKSRFMQDIIEYFTDVFHLNCHFELPLAVVRAINSLNRAERGEMKSRLFNEAKRLALGGDGLRAIRWLETTFTLIEKNSFRMHEVLFSPGKDIPENIAFLLGQANKSLDLCVFTISDEKLGAAILRAKARGIRVRLITDDNKSRDTGSQVKLLAANGIDVKIDHSKYHMHNKFGIIDSRIIFTGSYNWTYTAQNYNQENVVVTTNYTIVNQFCEEFERLWTEMFWLKVRPHSQNLVPTAPPAVRKAARKPSTADDDEHAAPVGKGNRYKKQQKPGKRRR